MSMTDPIADFLTRIRNGITGRKRERRLSALEPQGAHRRDPPRGGLHRRVSSTDENGPQGTISVVLRYDSPTNAAHHRHPPRLAARPARLRHRQAACRKVRNGLGIAIVSTSQGVMTDREARKRRRRRRGPLRGLVSPCPASASKPIELAQGRDRRRSRPTTDHGQGPQGHARPVQLPRRRSRSKRGRRISSSSHRSDDPPESALPTA